MKTNIKVLGIGGVIVLLLSSALSSRLFASELSESTAREILTGMVEVTEAENSERVKVGHGHYSRPYNMANKEVIIIED